MAVESLASVPRLPRGQGRLRLHGLGHSQLLGIGVAAALLPHVRWLRRVVQGAGGETAWEAYGRGRDDRCENCMAHCGYEPTAVNATMASPKESLRATADVLRGTWETIWSR